MTIEELKNSLLGKTYPDQVQISVDQLVTNPERFLTVQFADLERWTKDLEKSPAYVRLVKFLEATKEISQ